MGASLVYLNEPNTDIDQEEGRNSYLQYATGSMQGWRLNMEDSHVSNQKYGGTEDHCIFGVFDGHGGREVAIYTQKHYENLLTRTSNMKKESHAEWLRQSFLNIDIELRTPQGQNELRELRKEKPPKKPALLNILSDEKDKKDDETASEDMMLDSIGCTANVIYMDKKMKKIFVSNAGDSRCVMGKNGKSVEMSIDHKPEDQIEIDRITKAGSTISEGRVDGNLNLTRSLGDLKYKQREHLKPEEQAITANPDTYEFDLEKGIDFILMGCDGIWEKKSNEEAVAWVYDQIDKQRKNNQNAEIDIKKIVRDLLMENLASDVTSSGGVGCDNMTCILILFSQDAL